MQFTASDLIHTHHRHQYCSELWVPWGCFGRLTAAAAEREKIIESKVLIWAKM